MRRPIFVQSSDLLLGYIPATDINVTLLEPEAGYLEHAKEELRKHVIFTPAPVRTAVADLGSYIVNVPRELSEDSQAILRLGRPAPELVFGEGVIDRPGYPPEGMVPQEEEEIAERGYRPRVNEIDESLIDPELLRLSSLQHPGYTSSQRPAALHYRSRADKFMGRFLKTLYNQPGLALSVKRLTFSLPHDSLSSSGIFTLLGIDPSHPFSPRDSSSASQVSEQQQHPFALAGDELRHLLAIFQDPSRIPLQYILDMYVYLFSVCTEVQEVTIPREWEGAFRYGTAFPKVDVDRGGGMYMDGGEG